MLHIKTIKYLNLKFEAKPNVSLPGALSPTGRNFMEGCVKFPR